MSEQWSDKILQGLHNASEILAEQRRQIDEARAERDSWVAIRDEMARDLATVRQRSDELSAQIGKYESAVKVANKAGEEAWERVRDHDTRWAMAMAILGMSGELQGPDDVLAALRNTVEERDELAALNQRQGEALHEARNQLDDLRTEHACLQGDEKRIREEYERLRGELGEARRTATERGETIMELRNELANLRTERELWHMDAERRDQDRMAIAGHESRWAEAARILGIDDDPEWNISDVLEAISGTVRTADLAATLATGTGPVAVPETTSEPATMPQDGTLAVVARHSREIGTLQDDIRKVREDLRAFNDVLDTTSNRVSELERARPVTSAAMGTSEGLL